MTQTLEIHEETYRPGPLLSVTTAEIAECTCPEFCERDHEQD